MQDRYPLYVASLAANPTLKTQDSSIQSLKTPRLAIPKLKNSVPISPKFYIYVYEVPAG
jgi:hypothetical protein